MSNQCQLTDELERIIVLSQTVRLVWQDGGEQITQEGVLVGLDASQGQEWLTLKTSEEQYILPLSQVKSLTRLSDNTVMIPAET